MSSKEPSTSTGTTTATSIATSEERAEPDKYEQLEEEYRRDVEEGRRPPEVVILVGMPGAGKSTFADRLIRQSGGMWHLISQDDLRERWKVEDLCIDHLLAAKNVVIDRCNFKESQRLPWVEIGYCRGAKIGAVVMATPPDVCIQRAQNRWDHPCLTPGAHVPHIIDDYWAKFQRPHLDEGIEWCRYVSNEWEVRRVIDMLLE